MWLTFEDIQENSEWRIVKSGGLEYKDLADIEILSKRTSGGQYRFKFCGEETQGNEFSIWFKLEDSCFSKNLDVNDVVRETLCKYYS